MNECIQWCNANNGFLTALLALLSLFISVLAVVVSIKTAKLPYKKRLTLKVTFINDISKDDNGRLYYHPADICVNAVNTGNRAIDLTFLGFGCYIKVPRFYGIRKYIEREKTNINKRPKFKIGKFGLLENNTNLENLTPSKIATIRYGRTYFREFLETRIAKEKYLYAFAVDTEGWEYYCKFDTVQNVIAKLSDENSRSRSNKENEKTTPSKQKTKAKAS